MKNRQAIEIIARGVCIKRGKLLLCHTKGADNTYLPGGHVDFGESAVAALVREAHEELGVKSKVMRFLGAVEHSFTQKGRKICEVNLIFDLKIAGVAPDKKPESKEDYIDFFWVPVKELKRYRIEPYPLAKMILRWYGGRRISAGSWASTFCEKNNIALKPCSEV